MSIEDNGPGLREPDKLFEPFYTTKKPGEGLGLGLAISAGFAAELGGRLVARNAPDGGAVFELVLPREPGTNAGRRVSMMPNSNNTKSKVAIIDDEVDMRESVAQWLQLSGFEPISFDAAEPALKVIGPDFPGVVISDIRMPGMDGMALLRRLQSIDPGLPVILMTGHGDVPMAVEAMRIGAFDFVEKPFEPDRLADLCQRGGEARARTLETRALRRELSDGSVVMRRLMGASPAVEKLRETILDVAQADGHVLVLGETGTGKSLIAMALHACGPRAAKPLVTMNCASVAPERGRADALRRPRLAGEAADRPGRGRDALPRGHRGAVALGPGAAARRHQRQRHRERRGAAQHPHRRGVEPPRAGHAAARGAARRPLLPPRRPRPRGPAARAPAARTS